MTGVHPIDLKAMEQRDIYLEKRRGRNRVRDIKDYYLDKWQQRWGSGRVLCLNMPYVPYTIFKDDIRERLRNRFILTHTVPDGTWEL